MSDELDNDLKVAKILPSLLLLSSNFLYNLVDLKVKKNQF